LIFDRAEIFFRGDDFEIEQRAELCDYLSRRRRAENHELRFWEERLEINLE